MKTPLNEVEQFYAQALNDLNETGIPYLIGGTYAITKHTGIIRPTHDLDLFCKAGDYTHILQKMKRKGYDSEITDARWLAKITKNNHWIDFIFGTAYSLCTVNDDWFKKKYPAKLFGVNVHLIPPEEMIYSKSYRQVKDRYDGADVNHLILIKGRELDWKHLLNLMEIHWELLLAHIINFRFVYPADRDIIPKWLMKELLGRIQHQLTLPNPKDKVSRGRLLSPFDYEIDYKKWGYKDNTY